MGSAFAPRGKRKLATANGAPSETANDATVWARALAASSAGCATTAHMPIGTTTPAPSATSADAKSPKNPAASPTTHAIDATAMARAMRNRAASSFRARSLGR
jgi:hypothetical protein